MCPPALKLHSRADTIRVNITAVQLLIKWGGSNKIFSICWIKKMFKKALGAMYFRTKGYGRFSIEIWVKVTKFVLLRSLFLEVIVIAIFGWW